MADTHIHEHIQSVLVPKGHFKTEQQARKHVKEMGFKTDVKPVHITDNYYRYRQTMPKPSDHYRTINLDGVKAIAETGHGKTGIISHDPHQHLRNPRLHEPIVIKKASKHNHQKMQGANLKDDKKGKSRWDAIQDAALGIGQEYLKLRAINNAVEHTIKMIARK